MHERLKALFDQYVEHSNELRCILEHITHHTRESFFLNYHRIKIEEQDINHVHHLMERVRMREPLSKILQKKEFFSLLFKTTNNTLDPRPESEMIVDYILRHYPYNNTLLDLGTGTGCLAISVLHHLKHMTGCAVDICPKALSVCMQNAYTHGVAPRLECVWSNWFLSAPKKRFDLIISNPPYIDENDFVEREALYDPKIALYAKEKGLCAYRIILSKAMHFLTKRGSIIFECGIHQYQSIIDMAHTFGYKNQDILYDFQDIPRCLVFNRFIA
jgi:release factor glutamine methyltransferase